MSLRDGEPNAKLLKEIRDSHGLVDPETSCWNWMRGRIGSGYGMAYLGKKKVLAHRLAAHLALGFSLDSELCVLHHCDNRRCFNPEHLFIGDRGDNTRDCRKKGRWVGYQEKQTHCPQGHPYAEENLYVTPEGYRGCKTCRLEHTRQWRLRNKKAVTSV